MMLFGTATIDCGTSIRDVLYSVGSHVGIARRYAHGDMYAV